MSQADDDARRAILHALALGDEPNLSRISHQTGISTPKLRGMLEKERAAREPARFVTNIEELSEHPWQRVRDAWDRARESAVHAQDLAERWERRENLAAELSNLVRMQADIDAKVEALTAELVDMGILEDTDDTGDVE
jgi:alkylated DNA nucleotide flippase Atl1